jgi:hypothetical protein
MLSDKIFYIGIRLAVDADIFENERKGSQKKSQSVFVARRYNTITYEANWTPDAMKKLNCTSSPE